VNRPWSRLALLAAGLFFYLSYWADRVFFTSAPMAGSNTVFALFFSTLCLGLLLALVNPFGELARLLGQKNTPAQPVEEESHDRF
jgi:hypothetical protein